jgi:hypothetical protein
MPCHKYPPHARGARTFAELYAAYRLTWPAAEADAEADADHLLRLAHKVAAKFPDIELWDPLEECLQHTMRHYEPDKGRFDKLFQRNLRELLRKKSARAAEKQAKEKRRERHAVAVHHEALLRRAGDAASAAWKRWAGRLLDLVAVRLDEQTRTYLRMRRDEAAVKEIAEVLGVTEKTLWNKFGGNKLAGKIQQEVRLLVLELPAEHRQLLLRHLLEDSGLTQADVERLLGVEVVGDGVGPVLGEESLLEILGW